MSAKARQYHACIMKILADAGAIVTEKSIDGATHQCLTFIYRKQSLRFHFPSTGQLSGHAFENTKANLRRLLRSVPEPAPEPTEAKPMVDRRALDLGRPPAPLPTPPVLSRLTKTRRREIAKRYATTNITIEALAGELNITTEALHILILSQRGQAADKLRRLFSRRRSDKARAARGALAAVLSALEVPVTPAAPLAPPPVQVSKVLAQKLRTLHYYGMSAQELATTYKLPSAAVARELRHAA